MGGATAQGPPLKHRSCLAATVDERVAAMRPGVVHRLDKGTSGVIVVAKTKEALAHLGEAFKVCIPAVSPVHGGLIPCPRLVLPQMPPRLSLVLPYIQRLHGLSGTPNEQSLPCSCSWAAETRRGGCRPKLLPHRRQ